VITVDEVHDMAVSHHWAVTRHDGHLCWRWIL